MKLVPKLAALRQFDTCSLILSAVPGTGFMTDQAMEIDGGVTVR